MWKSIIIENTGYLAKWVDEKKCQKIFVSDIVNVWMEELDSTILMERWKELNPLLEADTERATSYLRSLIYKTEDATLVTNLDEQCRTLNIKSKVADTEFCFMFRMKKMDPVTVFQQLMFPLIMVTKHLYKEHQHLCEIIKHKDAEIEQYKIEGATLKRKKLETTPFDEMNLQEFPNSIVPKIVNRNVTNLFDPWLCEYITKMEVTISHQSSEVQQSSEICQSTVAITNELSSENTTYEPTVPKNKIFKVEVKDEPTTCEEYNNSSNIENNVVKRKIPIKRKPKLKF